MQENKAHITLGEGQTEAEAQVFQKDRNIGWLHGTADSPDAEADIVITDMRGNVQHTEKGVKFINKRFGKRIDLPINDNECIIKVENVKNAKKFDLFLE